MKKCKYCYSDIDKRASVCAVCHNNVTFQGSLAAFFLTVFPILTALISLGFAFYEKYEKGLVQTTLAETSTQLEAVAIENDVAQEAVESLTKMLPKMAGDFPPAGRNMPPLADQVSEIDKEISAALNEVRIDSNKVKELQRQKLELKTGRQLFGR